MDRMIKEKYELWLNEATDTDIKKELQEIADNDEKIEDAFYCNLAFGTGGLRGVIGAGTNRMNVYTVAKASQGLANYVLKNYEEKARKIAISYDSRINSDIFAEVAAEVFAANGIQIEMYKELMPTPCLSYAVRALGCAAGIMITASHNPAKYNGYKVYGEDGCQITTIAAKQILTEIEAIDIFAGVKRMPFECGIKEGIIRYISEDIYTRFTEEVKGQSLLSSDVEVDKNVAIIYSPLNGTGLKPVLRTLTEAGYTNITVVKEQESPNGKFPTCPYPNPEVKEAMQLGIEYAKKYDAELLLATDPDCDRVGIAVKDADGEYVLLSGNETGVLLLDYICARRLQMKTMPENPVLCKTIVTSDMGEQIAKNYGVETVNVLTGFKYIGEQIGLLEKHGKADSYIFGFEESYGYLSGSYVRDKDAVNGAFLICEMFAYYKSKNITLLERLEQLYAEYGYCLNTLHSYEFEGVSGAKKMQDVMHMFRSGIEEIGGKKVKDCIDYDKGIGALPRSNVLKFFLEDNCSVVIRPSGTEPKMKVYLSVCAENRTLAEKMEQILAVNLAGRILEGK